MKRDRENILFVVFFMLFTLGSMNQVHTQFFVDDLENTVSNENSLSDMDDDILKEQTKSANPQQEVINNKSFFGVWVNYQQQFGAVGGEFLTVGGPSFGFNLGQYFFIGGGVYSSFGKIALGGISDNSFIYGGGIAGFRWNPKDPVVFRTQILVGAIAFDTISQTMPSFLENRTISLLVIPEIAFDIRLIGYLFLSVSVSYRYVDKLPEIWSEMKGLGALNGSVSFGLSF